MDPAEMRLTRGGQEVVLQPKVFEALLVLVRRAGQLVTKQELMEALWPDTIVNEEALTQVIRKLRRALGDNPDQPHFIQTVLKRGYRFLPAVVEETRETEIEEPGDAAVQEDSPHRPLPHRLTRPRAHAPTRRVAFAVVVAALGIGLVVTWQAMKRSPTQPATGPFTTATMRVRRMTYFPEREEYGDFSPDGQSFVFVSKHEGQGHFKLYVMLTSGGNPVRLTHSDAEELAPQFSPNGQWIAYTRIEDKGSPPSIWKISAFGGQESLLVPDALYTDWSPDGQQIAFLRIQASGELVLMCRKFADDSERRICPLPGRSFYDTVTWSPDGQQIAFVSGEAAWVVPAPGGQPRRIAESAESIQSVAWMPDSQALICDANWGGRANLWLVPLNGDAPVPITLGSGYHRYPAVSHDGKQLLYTSEQWQRVLWIVDQNGQYPRQLATKTSYESLSIHPSGRWIAYNDLDAGPGEWTLGIFDIEMMGRRNLGSGFYPAFSPNGEELAFIREADGAEGLWVINLATGSERRITPTPGESVRPAWSPDGTRIVFERAVGAGSPGLTVVEVSSGRESFLASGAYASPAWSPDGRWIAVSGKGHQGSGLYLFEVATGRGQKISDQRSYKAAPIWAADSHSLRILIDERTMPALIRLTLAGAEISPRVNLEFIPDPSFWGIFDIYPLPGRGWIYLLQRVEADLYMLELSP